MSDFDAFWSCYPRKVAKLAAVKAYAKARVMATADEILAGVEAYKRHKPEYADYAHPASWLNAGRWMDEYDEPASPSYSMLDEWFHECRELHDGSCGGSFKHYHRMQIEKSRKESA